MTLGRERDLQYPLSMSESGKRSFWLKWLMMDFDGKTRFFQFRSTSEKLGFWLGFIVTGFFFPGVVLVWFLIGVIYYRIKFPREHGGI